VINEIDEIINIKILNQILKDIENHLEELALN